MEKGTRSSPLQALELDEKYGMSSEETLQMTDFLKSLIIVGGGVFGIEWASMSSIGVHMVDSMQPVWH